MEELNPLNYLNDQNLFHLFKQQLKKDFEGSGNNGDFADGLLPDFNFLKERLIKELRQIQKNNSQFAGLLYRIDISGTQLNNYQSVRPDMIFDEVVAELIIKRTLQKIILKKRFSS